MIKKTLSLLGLAATAFALHSCIDKGYDFDNIDKTLGTKADLTLRVGSLDTIKLKNVMDLEPDGVVQFVSDGKPGSKDSLFAVIQDGTADIDPIKIDEVKINPTIAKIDATVKLRELLGGGTSGAPRRKVRNINLDLPVIGSTPIDLDKITPSTFHYDIAAGEASNHIDAQDSKSKAEISKDVIEIVEVGFKNNTTLTLTMKISGFPNWLPSVNLKNLSLTIPTALKISKCVFMNQTIAVTSNVIQLTDATVGKAIPTNQDIVLALTIAGATKDDKSFFFDGNKNEVSFGGDFEVGGTFEINIADVDAAKLETYINSQSSATLLAVYNNGTPTLTPIMPNSISFTGDAKFNNGGITLKDFKGKLKHDIGKIDPIKLDDMPDFLDDPGVNLELDNPVLLLCAKQGVNVPVSIESLTLTSKTESGTKTAVTKKIDNIQGNSAANYFYIADKELTQDDINILKSKFPEYANARWIKLKSGSVKSLIEKIPDELEIEVAPVELDATTTAVDITKQYAVDIEYKVFAPMYIGKNFQLIYSDKEAGWAEDLEDFDALDVDSLNFAATATSNIPADIILTLVPIAADESEIKELIIDKIEVPAMANKKQVKFSFKPGKTPAGKDVTIRDILSGSNGVKKLDGIRYEAKIKGNADNDGKALPQDAYIILDDLMLTIKGDVSFDAN